MIVKVIALVVLLALAGFAWTGGLARVARVSQSAQAPSQAPRPTPGDQTIQITESDLNQRLNERLVGQPLGETPLGQATLTRIRAQLADGHLKADGEAHIGSASVPVSMTASSTVDNGRALVQVDDLRAAGMTLPASTREAVQHAVQAQVDDEVDRAHLRVSSVTIADGKLLVAGQRAP